MPIPVDLCSTEDHGDHLQREAARKRHVTLRPITKLVKSQNGKAVAAWASILGMLSSLES